MGLGLDDADHECAAERDDRAVEQPEAVAHLVRVRGRGRGRCIGVGGRGYRVGVGVGVGGTG